MNVSDVARLAHVEGHLAIYDVAIEPARMTLLVSMVGAAQIPYAHSYSK